MKRVIINIYGLVQGVFFRYTTRKVARKIGVTGIVKNMPDGSVFIEAEGSEDKLLELLEFAKKGPKYAQVERMEHKFEEFQSKFEKFDYAF